MKRVSSTVRIVVSLVCLTISGLLVARAFGLLADPRNAVMDHRAKMCESIAINFSLLAIKDDATTLEAGLKATKARNSDIVSLGVRRETGDLVFQAGSHGAQWVPSTDGKSSDTQMFVPVGIGNRPWGTVEVLFKPIRTPGLIGWLEDPLLQLMLFMTAIGSIGYYVILKRVLRQLDPSKVVPNRVRSALDTLTAGLLILDEKQRIVLANTSFGQQIGRTPESLIGHYISELAWRNKDETTSRELRDPPWLEAFENASPRIGVLLDLQVNNDIRRTFVVNSAPVFSDNNRCQGVLTSFEDVTPLEHKKRELHLAMDQLNRSNDEIRAQNLELERLATTDPLTECLNRRAFFSQFEGQWNNAERHTVPLSCIMVDIDFFKSINDQHGHSTGDEVLKGVAATLMATVRLGDLVCRFGGEEFSVLLPHSNIEEAAIAGERMRAAIAGAKYANLSITASIGVSAKSLGANDPHAMLDQADKCLYVAKRNGRNQVVRWDAVPANLVIDESKVSRTKPAEKVPASAPVVEPETAVPYRAVAALLGALAYRNHSTAEHCRRVADLCVAIAEPYMSLQERYLVEIAALLHDIGKVGIPDAILLKEGKLTDEEWETMRRQDTIGVEIIQSSFACEGLTSIIENRQAFFGGNSQKPGLAQGDKIPLGARILAVADAYDSMTHDSAHRSAMTTLKACEELRKCAGSQFDPQIVNRLITTLASRNSSTAIVSAGLSQETAIAIGSQMERLVEAIDKQDMDRLKTLADRLRATAAKHGATTIAKKATELEAAVNSDADVVSVLESACELIELCRSTQRDYLTGVAAGKSSALAVTKSLAATKSVVPKTSSVEAPSSAR